MAPVGRFGEGLSAVLVIVAGSTYASRFLTTPGVSPGDHAGSRLIWRPPPERHSVPARFFIWCKSPACGGGCARPLGGTFGPDPERFPRAARARVGRSSPEGLTVKQIARRCELTVATTYHLVRTLAYEGYVIRREDGTYIVGLEIADRYRELVTAFRGPPAVGESLRRAALDTGYSHYLGRFVGGQVAVTAVAEGARSPYLEDLVPGFDEGAHATALGKALLATLTPDQRLRYLREYGMRPFTTATLTTPEAFEADLAAGDRRGMQLELGQFRQGVACAAVSSPRTRTWNGGWCWPARCRPAR